MGSSVKMGSRGPSPERGRTNLSATVAAIFASFSLGLLIIVSTLYCSRGEQVFQLFRLFAQPVTMFRNFLAAAGVVATALPHASSATLLYVSSYSGTITTLNLTGATTTTGAPASLQFIASTTDCAPNPSWLTLDYPNSTLYCTNEGINSRNGSLSAFKTNDDGTLVHLDTVTTIQGPVSAAIYGEGGRGLALAE